MSTLLDAIAKVKVSIWQFIRLVFSANREYPYHDVWNNDDYSDTGIYVVGSNQINAHGDQHKLFVSKSTLIFSEVFLSLRFNSPKNEPVPILANTWYEFKSNIWTVYWDVGTLSGMLWLYFEGVLPEEARNPE